MLILLIHTAATWYLVGLVWFVQVVHYPLFSRVGGRVIGVRLPPGDNVKDADAGAKYRYEDAPVEVGEEGEEGEEEESNPAFVPYNEAHMSLTSWVVAPPMLVELVTAMWLMVDRPRAIPQWVTAVGLALVAVLWLSTALLQVPQHRALGSGFLSRPHRRLVLTNWLRTAVWSLRGGLVLWMVNAA